MPPIACLIPLTAALLTLSMAAASLAREGLALEGRAVAPLRVPLGGGLEGGLETAVRWLRLTGQPGVPAALLGAGAFGVLAFVAPAAVLWLSHRRALAQAEGPAPA